MHSSDLKCVTSTTRGYPLDLHPRRARPSAWNRAKYGVLFCRRTPRMALCGPEGRHFSPFLVGTNSSRASRRALEVALRREGPGAGRCARCDGPTPIALPLRTRRSHSMSATLPPGKVRLRSSGGLGQGDRRLVAVSRACPPRSPARPPRASVRDGAPLARRGKYARVPNRMEARRGHRRREAAEEREQIHVHRHRAVREWLLEGDPYQTVRAACHPLLRDRGA